MHIMMQVCSLLSTSMKRCGHGLDAREVSHLLALLLYIEAGGAAASAAHASAAQS